MVERSIFSIDSIFIRRLVYWNHCLCVLSRHILGSTRFSWHHLQVLLAWLYTTVYTGPLKAIFFYVYGCFHITGVYVGVVSLLGWYITGNWLTGKQKQVIQVFFLPHFLKIAFDCPIAASLILALFVGNLDDATRVFFTVNMRETFALPFLWMQIFSWCYYLRWLTLHEFHTVCDILGLQ